MSCYASGTQRSAIPRTTISVVAWGHGQPACDVTARERADRNAAIFDARARGFGWSRIAAEHGISERQAQRLYAEQRQNRPSQLTRDPVEMVEELLDSYDAAVDELAV